MDAVEALRTPDERFADLPGFDCAPRYADLAGGLRLHYVDEGPPEAETVLLLHGQPTWSYLYRTVVARLAGHGLRAVVPDLIGFGRSDKPVDRTAYTVQAHVDWLTEFVRAVGLRDVTLVVQDWGGPLGLGVLAAVPGLVRRVVATNTVLHTAAPELAGRLEWACHADADGTVTVEQMLLDYQRLTQELTPFRPSVFVQGATATDVPDDVLAAYDAPFPEERFCAGAAPAAAADGPHAIELVRRREPSHGPRPGCLRGPVPYGVLRRRPRHARVGRGAAGPGAGCGGAGARHPGRGWALRPGGLWPAAGRHRGAAHRGHAPGLTTRRAAPPSAAASGAGAAVMASGSAGAPAESWAFSAASSLSTCASLPTWSSSF